MKIIIVDHKDNLIITEANKTWAHKFFLQPDLLSTSNEVAQDYIDKWVAEEKRKTDDDVSSQIEELEIYKLTDTKAIQKLEPVMLGPSSEYGITVISLPLRQMVSLNEYQDINLIRPVNIQSLLEDSHPTFHRTPEEKLKALQNISVLIEKKLLEPDAFGSFMTGVEEVVAQYITKINQYIESKHKKTFPNFHHAYFNFKVSSTTTGWKTWSDSDYSSANQYEKLMRTLYDSGVMLSVKQEKYWHSYFYKISRKNKLNFDFLHIAREKETLNQKIVLVPKKNDKRQEKILKI